MKNPFVEIHEESRSFKAEAQRIRQIANRQHQCALVDAWFLERGVPVTAVIASRDPNCWPHVFLVNDKLLCTIKNDNLIQAFPTNKPNQFTFDDGNPATTLADVGGWELTPFKYTADGIIADNSIN